MKLKKLLKYLIISVLVLLLHASVIAQDSLLNSIDNDYPELKTTDTISRLPLSTLEFWLSIIVLSFGLIIILFELYIIRAKKIASEDVIKFITITLIIIATLFLITAGYDNNQIAPAVGLLGTIAGYLLGRINNSKNQDQNENNS